MRKLVEFTLGEKRLIAKEMTLREIMVLFQDPEVQATLTMSKVQEQIAKYLPFVIDGGLTLEDLPSFTPSELKVLWDKIKEANDAFFVAARALGLDQMVVQIKNQIWSNFSKLLVT